MGKKSALTVLAAVLSAALIIILIPRLPARLSGRMPQTGGETLMPAAAEAPAPFSKQQKMHQALYRPDQPDMYIKLHQELRTGAGETRPSYPAGHRVRQLQRALASPRFAKKADRGITWRERGPGNVSGRTRGLIVDPADPDHNTWFAGSASGGIWKTSDAGQSWEEKTAGLPNLATSTLAVSESNPDIMYAGTGEGFYNSDAVSGSGMFKSVDHGETWQPLSSTTADDRFRHVNRIIVDPDDSTTLLVCTNEGGILKSTNGGDSWTRKYESRYRVQQLVASPASFDTLWAAVNSVGVLKSVDRGETWTESSHGMDSMSRLEIAVSPSNPRCLYAAVENEADSDLYRSTDGGDSWTEVASSSGEKAGWLGQQGWYDNAVAVHPYNQNIVYLGGIDIWKAALNGESSSYLGISDVEENGTGAFMAYVNFGGSFLDGGMDLGENGLGASGVDAGDYTSVEIRFGPGRQQKAHRFIRGDGDYPFQDYMDVPFEVWDTGAGRQLMVSFRDHQNDGAFDLTGWIGSEPPREYIMIHAITYDPGSPDSVVTVPGGYAENSGPNYKCIYFIWPQLASGASWDPNNLPASNIRIRWEDIVTLEADFQRLSRWYASISDPSYSHADHHNFQIVTRGGGGFRLINGNDGGVAWSDNGGTTWNQTLNGYNTTQFYGAALRTLGAGSAVDTVFFCRTDAQDMVTVSLHAYRNGELYQSAPRRVNIIQFNEPAVSCSYDFTRGGGDFAANGFAVRLEDGFDGRAVHSDHPYEDNREYTLTLKTPIIVSADDPVVTYRDIALIEPGESGSAYGDTEFWDYAVTEASTDGAVWIPLAPGYDARYHSTWLELYNDGTSPGEEHFVTHTLNLRDHFAAGDTIIIRFRMAADAYTVGWGWVIDDLVIQPGASGIAEEQGRPERFGLAQNYPNPFNAATHFGFDLPGDSRVTLRIYDTVGRKAATVIDKQMSAGRHTVAWQADGLPSGVYFYRLTAGSFTSTKKLMLIK